MNTDAGKCVSNRPRISAAPNKAQRRLSASLLALAAVLVLAPAAARAAEDAEPSQQGLELVRFELLDRKGGYPIPADSVFYPGETVYLSFNITGYQVSDDYMIDLTYRIEAAGPRDVPIATPEGGAFQVEILPQDEDWEPLVNYAVKLPDHAGGGLYRIDVKVTDALAEETVERQATIRVEGENVELSDSLSVRNFAFSRLQGGSPLDPPVIGQGETLWASFYITGYETSAEDNAYDIESNLEILNSKGETMLAFETNGEKGAPFYPRLWLPASFRLDLDRNIPSGEYTIVLAVLDKVGGTEIEERRTFEVR